MEVLHLTTRGLGFVTRNVGRGRHSAQSVVVAEQEALDAGIHVLRAREWSGVLVPKSSFKRVGEQRTAEVVCADERQVVVAEEAVFFVFVVEADGQRRSVAPLGHAEHADIHDVTTRRCRGLGAAVADGGLSSGCYEPIAGGSSVIDNGCGRVARE